MAAAILQDTIMPLMTTRRMLGMAEKDKLGCAFGLTKDKKECLLLIAKIGSGKKIGAKLKADGKELGMDAGTLRFGMVNIDPQDPGTVRFTVNRSEAGGTIVTLTRLAKKAGYSGIVINVDEALEAEADDEDGEAAQAEGLAAVVPSQSAPSSPPKSTTAEPPPDPQALKARLTELVKRMIVRIEAEPALKDPLTALAKQAQVMLATNNLRTASEHMDALQAILDSKAGQGGDGLDADALHARLKGLVKRMMVRIAAEPASQDVMATLARTAQGALKSGELAAAVQPMDALERLLGPPSETGLGAPKGELVRLRTSRLIWDQARKTVESQLALYAKAVKEEFADEEEEGDILDALEQLDEIPLHLDDGLCETLDDMMDERTPPEEHAKLRENAIKQLKEYETFVQSRPLIGRLEGETPFGLTLTVASTLDKALKGLRQALR